MNTKENKEQNTHTHASKNKSHKNQNKQAEDKTCQNRAKQPKNPTVITLSFFPLVSYSWAWNVPWDVLNRSSDILLERVAIFLCQQLSVVYSFLFWGKALCLLLPFRAGNYSGLNLCRPCGCHHSFHEFICALGLLCLKSTVSITPDSYNFFLFCKDYRNWRG